MKKKELEANGGIAEVYDEDNTGQGGGRVKFMWSAVK